MDFLEDIKKPTKEEQIKAMESYSALASTLKDITDEYPEIEIEETQEKMKIPKAALQLLAKILHAMSEGKPLSIIPVASEMTTQSAAEFLGCSRPHLVKLLETGKIPFTKVGRHRRVKYEDLTAYRNEMKTQQRKLLQKMMSSDENSGLYDT